MFPHLPCICNARTKDPSEFVVEPEPVVTGPGNTVNGTTVTASVNPTTSTSGTVFDTTTDCVSLDSALETVDFFGGREASDQGCLESPASCPGLRSW